MDRFLCVRNLTEFFGVKVEKSFRAANINDRFEKKIDVDRQGHKLMFHSTGKREHILV